MTSIYRRALGRDFERLHPKVRERFGFSSEDGVASLGRGVMERVWHGGPFTLPFLSLGTRRRILFPERGRDVPFTVENYAYRDRFGRETVTWIRSFATPAPRRFDATMVWSDRRGRIVDYLGTHQHLAVDIDLSVDDEGGLRLRSGEQRFYEGSVAFRFPMLLTGIADVREWWDDRAGRYRIRVDVANPAFGPLFGYEGSFEVTWVPCAPERVPPGVRPLREERRE